MRRVSGRGVAAEALLVLSALLAAEGHAEGAKGCCASGDGHSRAGIVAGLRDARAALPGTGARLLGRAGVAVGVVIEAVIVRTAVVTAVVAAGVRQLRRVGGVGGLGSLTLLPPLRVEGSELAQRKLIARLARFAGAVGNGVPDSRAEGGIAP